MILFHAAISSKFQYGNSLRTFKRAESVMKEHGWVLANGNVQTTQMRRALESTFGKKAIRMCRQEAKWATTYVLYVKYRKKYRHWVVVHKGKYFDPLPRFRKPRKSISYTVSLGFSVKR